MVLNRIHRLKRTDFSYHLPKELIAYAPCENRSESRLLVYQRQTESVAHRQFKDILDYLKPNDCLVINNTKVLPARLLGNKPTGGKVECLVERMLDEKRLLCHVKASKALKPGDTILIENQLLQMVERRRALFLLHVLGDITAVDLLNQYGHMPLPPYIERADNELDKARYQTVFAKEQGAVAAPTAGLHFDNELLEKLKTKGIQIAQLTLHVGAGTFQPVRVDNIQEHSMHSEWAHVSSEAIETIKQAKAQGGRVIAVGTTAIRSLETAALSGELQPFEGDTDIFIYPGFEFKVVDGMVTNFHLSESTLIMLVSAFLGRETTLALYQQAIEARYRFFSYGDACLFL